MIRNNFQFVNRAILELSKKIEKVGVNLGKNLE